MGQIKRVKRGDKNDWCQKISLPATKALTKREAPITARHGLMLKKTQTRLIHIPTVISSAQQAVDGCTALNPTISTP
jgi:hypothetical protein